jgi:uncharacterized protein
VWFTLLSALLISQAKAFEVPALTGPVVDKARIIAQKDQIYLEDLIRRLNAQGVAQLQVLTVRSLQGVTIEQASIRVVEHWQLGSKKSDNGLLLMVALDERKVRIEVGQGLEGTVPDIYAKRIIEDQILPLFRQGLFSFGVVRGVENLVRLIAPEFVPAQSEASNNVAESGSADFLVFFFVFSVIVLINILQAMGFIPRRGRLYGSWGGGMGSGGFGGGGGSWSGSGGGFSGGGASGGW